MILRILIFITLISPLIADQKGTLIVSYRTGIKGERLDRIRFWLKNEDQDSQMFPKKGDQENPLKRIVVIKDLNPGNYSLDFIIPNQDGLFEPIPPKEVVITEDKITEVDQVFQPRYASLQALALSTDQKLTTSPTLTLKNNAEEVISKSNAGELTANHLLPGNYILYFEEVPGFEVPKPMTLSLGANEKAGPFIAYYAAADIPKPATQTKLLPVPAGEAIIGDTSKSDPENQLPSRTTYISPFSIGKYEVTNAEYAKWLTRALKDEKIQIKSGLVKDSEEHLLFKTKEADIYSQIQFQLEDHLFSPLEGKENHPVIDVSWYGAVAYCKANHFRLPTEAEWEKAAGMALTKIGEPLKKFIFGFSQDTIDPTWANYRSTDRSLKYFQLLTKEVGFYDGSNTITINGKEQKTNNAKSPIGAYDMSGNVWEWVSDWYSATYEEDFPKKDPKGPSEGTKKIVKGGCYDSLADGVRVAERLGLAPDHTDPYTGFRVAK